MFQKRESLEEMEASEAVTALEKVMDAMINDSCAYVSVIIMMSHTINPKLLHLLIHPTIVIC